MRFELKQLKNNVFILSFDNYYDLGMHFLRMSEYRESTRFMGQRPSLVDLMEDYAKKHTGTFSYPVDWEGYNLPGSIMDGYPHEDIPDPNKYDNFMLEALRFIRYVVGSTNFYVIGHVIGREDVVDHELAHAIYHMDPDFKEEVDNAWFDLSESHQLVITETLEKMGYGERVWIDEAQAYLSTGLSDELAASFRKRRVPKIITKPFEKIFKKYKKELFS